jgi:hypothetical protein
MDDRDTPLPLHAFLSGEGTDGAGRTVLDVLAFSRQEIEAVHDFVQWLFPNRRPSAFEAAPVLTDAEAAAIRADPAALGHFRAGIAMMTRFYAATDRWLGPMDHNQLRITRILTATRELVSVEEARRLLAEIEARADAPGSAVSARTRRFWREAAG